MTIESLPTFTKPARQRWESIPADIRQRLLSNVWCGQCRHETTITNFSGTIKGGDLLLVGKCAECRSDVARVIEGCVALAAEGRAESVGGVDLRLRLCRGKPPKDNQGMSPLHLQLANSTLRRVIKRLHFPLEVMLVCVRWYAAYPLSLRNLVHLIRSSS